MQRKLFFCTPARPMKRIAKLHTVIQLAFDNHILCDQDDLFIHFQHFLNAKFACDEPIKRVAMMNRVLADEGCIESDSSSLRLASLRIQRKTRLDAYGVTPLSIHLAITQCESFGKWFSNLVTSAVFFENLTVPCKVFSKVRGITPLNKTHMIFPLP